jgi:hypothetical protein
MRLDRLGNSTNVLVTIAGNLFGIRIGNPQTTNTEPCCCSSPMGRSFQDFRKCILHLAINCPVHITISIFRGLKRPVREATHVHLKSRFRAHGHYSVMRRPGGRGMV